MPSGKNLPPDTLSVPKKMRAVLLDRPGPPEVLRYAEVPTPVPAAGQVLVKAHTIGVSMPEILVRRGEYGWMPPLPAIPGIEMSGTVAALGEGVTSLGIGQAVFVSARELPVRAGCYAEYLAANAEALYPLPEGADLEAAAALSNYQVAWHLLHSAPNGMPYESVLVTGAGGGIGSAVVQLGKIAGKIMIGLTDTEEKASFVRSLGADGAIHAPGENVNRRVLEMTGGRGVDLILDSIGGTEFVSHFERLAPFGAGNSEPLFALPRVVAQNTRVLGTSHLQITLARGAAVGHAIAFGMADRNPGEGTEIDVIGTAEVDRHRGSRRPRVRVKHLIRRPTT